MPYLDQSGLSKLWARCKAVFALKASPTFTGTPKAPTAAAGTNTTQIATTAFVQSAVAGAGTGAADYVVAQGTCDFWQWRMWNSGIAECWGKTSSASASVSTAWGSLYEGPEHHNGFPGATSESSALAFSATVGGTTYTKLFKEAPAVCECSFASGNNAFFLEVGAGLSATRTPSVYLLRPTSATVAGCYCYRAVGRWK